MSAGGGAVAGAIAAVIAQQQAKVINYLKERSAYDMSSAVAFEDNQVQRFFEKYRGSMGFIRESNGKYWLDQEAYGKSKKNKLILIAVITGVLVLGIVAALLLMQ